MQVLAAGRDGVNGAGQMEKVGHTGCSHREGGLEAAPLAPPLTNGSLQPAEHSNGYDQDALLGFHHCLCLWWVCFSY